MNYLAFWINNGKESKNNEMCVKESKNNEMRMCMYACHNWKSILKMLVQK